MQKNRFVLFGALAALVLVVSLAATWQVLNSAQEPPAPDEPDPTSALLPPAVSQEEWDEYYISQTEGTEIETVPLLFDGIEAAGATVVLMEKEITLPDNVYIVSTQFGGLCDEDPYDVCAIPVNYSLRRTDVNTDLPGELDAEIVVGGGRAWYFPSIHPDLRGEIADAYAGVLADLGIETLEDIGYIEVEPIPTEDPIVVATAVATMNAGLATAEPITTPEAP